jgi:hypothetical protein
MVLVIVCLNLNFQNSTVDFLFCSRCSSFSHQQYPRSRNWTFLPILGKSRNSTNQRNINLKKRSSKIYGIQEIIENTKKLEEILAIQQK